MMIMIAKIIIITILAIKIILMTKAHRFSCAMRRREEVPTTEAVGRSESRVWPRSRLDLDMIQAS